VLRFHHPDVDTKPPDVLLLSAVWPERALLRAQLIEQGYEVVAIDRGPIPRLFRRPAMKPRVIVIDLRDLPDPRAAIDEVRLILPPHRVVVLMALGTIPEADVRHLGFHVIDRPATVGDVVAAVGRVLAGTVSPDKGLI
jgi:hypothetical protein